MGYPRLIIWKMFSCREIIVQNFYPSWESWTPHEQQPHKMYIFSAKSDVIDLSLIFDARSKIGFIVYIGFLKILILHFISFNRALPIHHKPHYQRKRNQIAHSSTLIYTLGSVPIFNAGITRLQFQTQENSSQFRNQ